MIIMALDHVRDLIHSNSIAHSPTDLQTTSPVLFFTRWITYLCAPTFVFLAGTSAYISSQRKNDIAASRKDLVIRGFYLIALEFIVVNFALFFDPGYHMLLFEVIASTGFGFIILGLILKLPLKAIGIMGLVIIFLHNLTPFVPFAETSAFKQVFMPFFSPAGIPFGNRVFVMGYPPIPWLGIMLVGYAAGKLFALPPMQRNKLFWQIGGAALVLFVVIRYINVYGDSFPWSVQRNSVYTFLSFMNVTKYPPSLVFCLVTLGVMFLMLAVTDKMNKKVVDVISVYGRVPLFYFLVHFFLIHFILLGVLSLQGIPFSHMEFASGTFGRPKGIPTGLPLWAIYLIWISVVIVLYWPCKWFGRYKATHKGWWLKYL
jgi:uncharacterized membrane protein